VKRTLLILTLALLMAVVTVAMSAPAFGSANTQNGNSKWFYNPGGKHCCK
jgi:hypothetical protein